MTEAAPSITVPSAGMMSLASTSTTSPRRKVPASAMWYSLRSEPSSRFLSHNHAAMEKTRCSPPRHSANSHASQRETSIQYFSANTTVRAEPELMGRRRFAVRRP
jgi:hypothetical protein